MLPHGPFSEVRTAEPFSRKARGARKVPTGLSLGELGDLCVSTEPHNENRWLPHLLDRRSLR
jgi:hypothetical protein